MIARTLFPEDALSIEPVEKTPHNGTAPSRFAAELMKPHAARQRERVMEFILAAGDRGLTDEEIQEGLGLSGNSERPRRTRLVELGRVKDSGNLRMTRAGRPATVWMAVDPTPVASNS
jgi:hypothetical protein